MDAAYWAKIGVQSIAAALAGAAAIYWYLSTRVATPETFAIHVVRSSIGAPISQPLGGSYVGNAYSEDLLLLASQLKKQSELNKTAALLAAASAAVQALIVFWH